MDYSELSVVTRHPDWLQCQAVLAGSRFFVLSTRGGVRYDTVAFKPGDVFVFGSESAGLPPALLAGIAEEQRLRLPMQPGVRSLNLSNTVAIVAYEAWRQQCFSGGL
jgi:tRNA (cytidine/uridine-2'-O-)-methyltransferase